MTKKASLLGLLAFAASLTFLGAIPAANAATQGRILVIDRNAVLRNSKVGQDIVRQVNSYTDQAEKDIKGQVASLRSQFEAMKQQSAILSNDVKAKKVKEFEARQAGLQQAAQKKQGLIQGGFFKARHDVEQALGPILQGIMVERGATMLLDRNAVVMGTDASVDITGLAVQRLDQKLPTLKVELTPLPPGMQQQLQQQGQ
ncbi:MAG: OmpH family outer membrane protein [Alphaproteobacteria bacterium]|nr:OmpH family outer membrane protein [Alphaproteobacteria bacterium]